MIRSSFAVILAFFASCAAHAGDASSGESAQARVDGHCAGLGEGFFVVAGSNACIRISGHISAGVGFAGAATATESFGPRLGGAPASGFDAQTAVSGDLRFDTEAGPARIYVGARRDTNPRWALDGQ
ncbi:MAG: hypothetical protein ABSG83_10460 [Roseiarcus sp.]|jgi:hypothetical protein